MEDGRKTETLSLSLSLSLHPYRKMVTAVSPLIRLPLIRIPSSYTRLSAFLLPHLRLLNVAASMSSSSPHHPLVTVPTQHQQPTDQLPSSDTNGSSQRWRPMCLYYTQDKCTKVLLLLSSSVPVFALWKSIS